MEYTEGCYKEDISVEEVFSSLTIINSFFLCYDAMLLEEKIKNKMFESMVEKELRNSKLNQIAENDVNVHNG